MQVPLKKVHIGNEIKKVFDRKTMTKTKFGELIGVRQQHVNRIFNLENMSIAQLSSISTALDYNFFTCYVEPSKTINVDHSAVAIDGSNSNVYIGDEGMAAEIRVLKAEIASLQKEVALLSKLNETNQRLVDVLSSQPKQ